MRTEKENLCTFFTASFGEDATATAESKEIIKNLNTFDSLEYECWDLIKKYGEHFGIKITAEDDIDFLAAKTVQDSILNLFTEAGFVFVREDEEESTQESA